MQIQATSQIFKKTQPFRLPIKTITYNSDMGKVTKNVNWAKEFKNPHAGEYYKKLREAQLAKDIQAIVHWGQKMGDYKIIDLDAKPAEQTIGEWLENFYNIFLGKSK